MTKLKDGNYISIQKFMVSRLELSGNELIAYALIYGFSQDGESSFKGSLSYVAEWLNCSKATACSILNKLASDGFLEKREKNINGVKFCDYIAINPDDNTLERIRARKMDRKGREKAERYSKNFNTHAKSLNGYAKNFNGGMQKTLTHNIIDNIDDNINDNIDTDALKDKSFKGGMDASSRGEKVVGRSRSYDKGISKTEYTQEQLESYLPNKIRELYGQEAIALDGYADELVKIVMYFYRRYKYYCKENHPILSDISYRKIVLAFLEPPEIIMEYGDFSFESYKVMIDKYFATDFGKYSGAPENFNYRLSHFMSDNIREHLYLQTCI